MKLLIPAIIKDFCEKAINKDLAHTSLSLSHTQIIELKDEEDEPTLFTKTGTHKNNFRRLSKSK